jgi:hypothetical protein
MSDFFRRYVDELLADEAFRARHPHFHVRLFLVADLDHVEIGTLTGRDLREYNKALAALVAGNQIKRITVDLIEDETTATLSAGEPILLAARDAGETELWARVRYDSRAVVGAWWSGAGVPGATNAPGLQLILNEASEIITAEDDIELAS